MKLVQRGLDRRSEQNPQQIIRDTRTFGQRVGDFFRNSTAIAVLLMMLGVSAFFLPGLSDVILLTTLIVFAVAVSRKSTLAFRLPQSSGRQRL